MAKGRPNQIGLEFFSINVNMFSDIKVRKLIKYQGGKSMSVYIYLLCIIYENGYYIKWDEDLPFVISEVTGFEEDYISEVIYQCLEIGLFDKEMYEKEKIITSKGIQNRYNDICKRAKRTASIKKFSLITSEEIPITSEEKPFNSEEIAFSSEEKPINSELMQQRKGKESKGKESKEKECLKKESKEKKSEENLHTQEVEIFETSEVENSQDTFEEDLLRLEKEIPTLETQEEIPLQKSSAKKVSPTDDVFLNNLSEFQNNYPNTKRFQEICMFNHKTKEFIIKLFAEFIEANRKSREHATKEDYTYFYQSLDKHFFYWVKVKISKLTTQTKREQQSEFYKSINEGKSITEILGV